MSFRTYSDGRPKVPRLGAMCGGTPGMVNHRLCGGWWCICDCHDEDFATGDLERGEGSEIGRHVEHEWKQVDRCVYCTCSPVRLYQGTVITDPEERRALGAYFDAIYTKTEKEWGHMRAEVLAARNAPHRPVENASPQRQ